MVDRFLVPTDGSGPATAALELALRIASATTTVYVLCVDEPDTDAGPEPDAILADARETTATTGTEVVTDLERGEPRERILEYADAHDVDLIVVGSHGRQEIAPLILGRVAEGVVRNASAPVLVVRASDDIRRVYPYERVLVPTDGSDHANAALELAIEIAAEAGATLQLLSIVPLAPFEDDAEADRVVDRLEENARSVLDAAAERATARGVDVRTTVEVGSVHGEIANYAEATGVDLLVMGAHGHGGDDRDLLGSVTERVLRIAPAPVLTVRVTEPRGDGE
jgi:nucleotide-binding universal stress UspA family protein